jgi:hypothetical protein
MRLAEIGRLCLHYEYSSMGDPQTGDQTPLPQGKQDIATSDTFYEDREGLLRAVC